MTQFRCKRSGNLVSFTNEDDIKGLRKHEGYTEVIENVEVKTTENANENAPHEENAHEEIRPRVLKIPIIKKRGRPTKQR